MQDGTFSYPEDGADFKYLLELRAEAEYYCLSSLVEQIDRFPVSHPSLFHCAKRLWLHSVPLYRPSSSFALRLH